MERLRIAVIVGSVRAGRISLPIAYWVASVGHPWAAVAADLLDLAEWDLPMFAEPNPPATGRYTGEKQRAWADVIGASDGFILVAPEYNHGPSAVLKNALDTVYAEWTRKPVTFVSYGGMGGARSVEQLRLTAVALQMAPLESAVQLVSPWIKREGERWNGDANDLRRLGHLFDDLAWWGAALKAARAQAK